MASLDETGVAKNEVCMGRVAVKTPRATERDLALLGDFVRIARANNRLTQAELAKQAFCSTRTIAAIEAGSPTTSVGVVFNVLQALRIPIFDNKNSSDQVAALNLARQTRAFLPARIRKVDEIDVDF